MDLGQALAVGALALAVAALLLVVVAVVRHSPRPRAAGALGRGEFEEALAAAETGPGGGGEELLAAAVGAKHLLELARAEELLARALALDPEDGEAWLERGLVAAYAGRLDEAEGFFARAGAVRADLAESLTLHRAWVALAGGRREEAARLFGEVEAPIGSKLRTDLGPGDPLFCEWFLHAADLWAAGGDRERADWARREGLRSAPQSRLAARLAAGDRPPLQPDSPPRAPRRR